MDEQPDAIERVEKPRRRWLQFRLRTLLIVVAILAVPLTYFVHFIYGPSVRKGSYVVFRVMEAPPSIWSANPKPDREEFALYKRNLAEFARAPNVINGALNDKTVANLPLIKQLGSNAADWLADQIVVNNPADSEVMEIGMLDHDQTQATVIAKALARAFQNEVINKEQSDNLQRRDRLDKKFRAYKSNILEKQRQLFELEQMVGPKDDHNPELANRLHRLEQAAADADRGAAAGRAADRPRQAQARRVGRIVAGIQSDQVGNRFGRGRSQVLERQIRNPGGANQRHRKANGFRAEIHRRRGSTADRNRSIAKHRQRDGHDADEMEHRARRRTARHGDGHAFGLNGNARTCAAFKLICRFEKRRRPFRIVHHLAFFGSAGLISVVGRNAFAVSIRRSTKQPLQYRNGVLWASRIMVGAAQCPASLEQRLFLFLQSEKKGNAVGGTSR